MRKHTGLLQLRVEGAIWIFVLSWIETKLVTLRAIQNKKVQYTIVYHRSRLRKNKIQWTTWLQCRVFEALAHKTQKLSLQAEAILYARSALEDPSNLSLFPFSWWNSRKVHSLISLLHSIFPYPSTDLFCMIRAMFGPQKAEGCWAQLFVVWAAGCPCLEIARTHMGTGPTTDWPEKNLTARFFVLWYCNLWGVRNPARRAESFLCGMARKAFLSRVARTKQFLTCTVRSRAAGDALVEEGFFQAK